jgi:hypothetical protein
MEGMACFIIKWTFDQDMYNIKEFQAGCKNMCLLAILLSRTSSCHTALDCPGSFLLPALGVQYFILLRQNNGTGCDMLRMITI